MVYEQRRISRKFCTCRGVAQPGSALAWGASGRGFKSRRPDQIAVNSDAVGVSKQTGFHKQSVPDHDFGKSCLRQLFLLKVVHAYPHNQR